MVEQKNRNKEMLKLRKKGWTYQKIADKYGLCNQRVWKIINTLERKNEK